MTFNLFIYLTICTHLSGVNFQASSSFWVSSNLVFVALNSSRNFWINIFEAGSCNGHFNDDNEFFRTDFLMANNFSWQKKKFYNSF